MLKKVLVIDDNYENLYSTQKILGERMYCKFLTGDCYQALRDLREVVPEKSFAPGEFGVLTDLYIPHVSPDIDDRGEMAPLGLLVMAECQRLGIPCVIVTAGWHHGEKYHQIDGALIHMGWPRLVDSSSSETESGEKNWQEGLRMLEEIAAKMHSTS